MQSTHTLASCRLCSTVQLNDCELQLFLWVVVLLTFTLIHFQTRLFEAGRQHLDPLGDVFLDALDFAALARINNCPLPATASSAVDAVFDAVQPN